MESKKKMGLPISTIDNPGTNTSIWFVQSIARTEVGGKYYDFKHHRLGG